MPREPEIQPGSTFHLPAAQEKNLTTLLGVLEKKDKVSPKINPFLILRIVLAVFLAFALIFYFRYTLRNITALGKEAQIQKVKVKVLPASVVKPKYLVLEVRTKTDCWLKVRADNQTLFKTTLPKGRRERWQAKERIELRIGKPEALEVFLNGKRIDLKKARVKKSLLITHEGIEGK